MAIRVTEKALSEGILRVWLKRIPVESGHVVALREADGRLAGTATLYGRGEGSDARERTMLYVRLDETAEATPLLAGDRIDLCMETGEAGEYEKIDLDVIEVI